MKRGDRAALRGDGEHQQERTAQNQRGKAENDDLRGIHMSAQFENSIPLFNDIRVSWDSDVSGTAVVKCKKM